MNKKLKKVLMLVLLVIIVAAIIIFFVVINNKEKEQSKSSDTTDTTTQSINSKQDSVTLSTDVIEIKDKYFIQTTNDIFTNLSDYIGKTVKIEGLMYSYEEITGEICYAVIKNTPGCCGSDGIAGLNIKYDGTYPKENTWVSVVGVIEEWDAYEGTADLMPRINVISIEEGQMGTTFVTT